MVDIWWTTLGLGIAVCWLLYNWSTGKHEHWEKRGVGFVQPVPFFGNMVPTLFKLDSFPEAFEKFYYKLKPYKIGGLYEFHTPTLMVTDPELIRDITVKHFDHFADRRNISSRKNDPLFSRSLPSLKGAEWREMRNRLSPAFTTSKLRVMFPLLSRCCEQFARFLVTRPSASTEQIELKSSLSRHTNDVIATIAFGVEANAIKNPQEKFYKSAQTMVNFSGIRLFIAFGYMLCPGLMEFLGLSITPKEETTYFTHLIKGTMEYREKESVTRPDMLQMLMEAQKGGIKRDHEDEHDAGTIGEDEDAAALHRSHLNVEKSDKNLISDEDIAAQAFVFFFAGYETVSTMLSFMSYELALNPDVQDKLREEIDTAILENNGELTYDIVKNLKYLDMVVSESLRKYPPVGFTDRTCVKSFKVPDTDLVIDKGTVITIPMYPMQRDPQYFPDPLKFDPERFNDENKKNIKPYTYLPFGSGPHNCIGMRFALLEVKLTMCYLLATCKLRVSAKTEIPLKLSKKTFLMTTDAGFWLLTIPRENPTISL